MSSIFKVNGKDTEFIAANAPQTNSSKAQPLLNGVQHVDKIVFNNQTVYNLTDEMSWVSYPELTPQITSLSSYDIPQTSGGFGPIDWCTTDPAIPVRICLNYYYYRTGERTPTQVVDYTLPAYTGTSEFVSTSITSVTGSSVIPGLEGTGSGSIFARRYKNGKLSLSGGTTLYANSGEKWTLRIEAHPELPSQPYYDKSQTQTYFVSSEGGEVTTYWLTVQKPSSHAVIYYVYTYACDGTGTLTQIGDNEFKWVGYGSAFATVKVWVHGIYRNRSDYLACSSTGSLTLSSKTTSCSLCTTSASSCGSCSASSSAKPCAAVCRGSFSYCPNNCTSNVGQMINDPGTPEQPGIEEISQWAEQQDIDLSEFISNLNSQLVVFKETPPQERKQQLNKRLALLLLLALISKGGSKRCL